MLAACSGLGGYDTTLLIEEKSMVEEAIRTDLRKSNKREVES